MIEYQYLICVDDQNKWSIISMFDGAESKAMDSLKIYRHPKKLKNTFTASTPSLYELNYEYNSLGGNN